MQKHEQEKKQLQKHEQQKQDDTSEPGPNQGLIDRLPNCPLGQVMTASGCTLYRPPVTSSAPPGCPRGQVMTASGCRPVGTVVQTKKSVVQTKKMLIKSSSKQGTRPQRPQMGR
jgi:hypothetical protein